MSEPNATPAPATTEAAPTGQPPKPDATAAAAPAGTADASHDPDDPDVAPQPDTTAAPAAEAPAAKVAREVMQRRDASQLAAIVREKTKLEAQAAKHKEREADIKALDEFHRLIDEGDPGAAVQYMLAHKAGDEGKALSVLRDAYDGLTQRILGVESKPGPGSAKAERIATRADRRTSESEQKIAALEAKLAERDAQEHERAVKGAVTQIGDWLNAPDSSKAYAYLVAEADDPAEVIWSMLEQAQADGVDMTVEQAAQLANDHFQPIATKKRDRYNKHLLAPEKANDTPSKPETTKSANGTSRKSLTNRDASQAPGTKPEPPRPRNDQERAEMSWAKLREGTRNNS